MQFWGFSVLHCNGVFPSGDQQQQQQKPLQRQEEKVAKIHIHSSKRKKPPKLSFSMGFRSYVRHFWGASPSFTAMVFSHPGTSSSSSKSLCSSRKKRQPKFIAAARGKSSQNHHFLWVSEVTLGIFGVQFWGFSVLHCHCVFPSGTGSSSSKSLCSSRK